MSPQYSTKHRVTSAPSAPEIEFPEPDFQDQLPTPVWWLQVASSSPQNLQRTAAERELARRSDLVAWLTLGLLGCALLLTPIAFGDINALIAIAGFIASLVVAIAFNRAGLVHTAGVLLVICIVGALLVYMLTSPLGLTMGQLPNYDAAFNSAIIVADYMLQPHNANIAADAALYPSVTQQTISLLSRPIALQFIFAVVAYLWVRGVSKATSRADRAEEVAELERRELERTVALEEGVRYLHQTLVLWMNGDFRTRMPAMPVEALQRLSDDLNAFINQVGPRLQTDFYYRRTQEEARRLAAALQAQAEGRRVTMPAPSGTPVDVVIESLRMLGFGGPRWGP